MNTKDDEQATSLVNRTVSRAFYTGLILGGVGVTMVNLIVRWAT